MIKEKPDIEINTIKGLISLILIILFLTVVVILSVWFIKDYKQEREFWKEIKINNLGSCNYTLQMDKCIMRYKEDNKTFICNLALKYNRKDFINDLDICNFKIT